MFWCSHSIVKNCYKEATFCVSKSCHKNLPIPCHLQKWAAVQTIILQNVLLYFLNWVPSIGKMMNISHLLGVKFLINPSWAKRWRSLEFSLRFAPKNNMISVVRLSPLSPPTVLILEGWNLVDMAGIIIILVGSKSSKKIFDILSSSWDI